MKNVPVIRFWRDRKVRDVLWQALATVGLVVVVVFFVRNASDNMGQEAVGAPVPVASLSKAVTLDLCSIEIVMITII